ncbi:MAG TPA: inositol monophosphatase family protein [Candidatus Limnocylindrales bacterium]|nr:inositol monophosphatase family protein [Candidatus Limnocylindrales bacterium]
MTASAWLPIFREIAAEIRRQIVPLAGTGRGRAVVGAGAGGDQTVFLDAAAEEIAVRHLEKAYRSGLRFQLVSEELGTRDFGGDALILVDPVDGSLNAKQGVPYYAVVLAMAGGPTLQDVEVALVWNLATGEEFSAQRSAGAFHDGRQIEPQALDPGDRYPLVQMDASRPLAAIDRVRQIVDHAERLRILGSVGLNLCYTATGAIALTMAPLPMRAFDLAGPLLILREAGGVATDLEGGSLSRVPSDLSARTTLLASASAAAHARALQLLGHR